MADKDEDKPIIVGADGKVETPAEETHAASVPKRESYRMTIPMSDRTSPLLPNRSDDDIVRRITHPGERKL